MQSLILVLMMSSQHLLKFLLLAVFFMFIPYYIHISVSENQKRFSLYSENPFKYPIQMFVEKEPYYAPLVINKTSLVKSEVVKFDSNAESLNGNLTFFGGSLAYSGPNCDCLRFGERPKAEWINSTCSDFSSQRGKGQKVLSYSLYFPSFFIDIDSSIYVRYFSSVTSRLKEVLEHYPDWTVRLYHNISILDKTGSNFLCRLYCLRENLDLCNVKDLPEIGNAMRFKMNPKTWNLLIIGDPTVDVFLLRNTEMIILPREVEAVNQWLNSNEAYHVIRDHPRHNFPVIAGLWGGRNRNVTGQKQLLKAILATKVIQKSVSGLISKIMWKTIQNDTLQHDSYHCETFGNDGKHLLPFPSKRTNKYFCGFSFFKNQLLSEITKTKCPLQCRPKDHLDWEWC